MNVPARATALLLIASAAACTPPADDPGAAFAPPTVAESLPSVLRRAHALWETNFRDSRGADVLEFIAGLGERLDEASWWAISAPAVHGWKQHRDNPELREAVLRAGDTLVAGLCDARAVDALSEIVRIACADPFDGPSLNALLAATVSDPLPATGFAGSRQEAVLAAALVAGEFKRCQEYFARLALPADAPAESRAAADRLKKVLDLCRADRAQEPADPRPLIEAWTACGSDARGRQVLQPAIERAVLARLVGEDLRSLPSRLRDLLDRTSPAGVPSEFWETLIARSAARPSDLQTDIPSALGSALLVKAYTARSGNAGLGSTYWIPAGAKPGDESSRLAHRYLALASEALEHGELDMAESAAAEAGTLSTRADDPGLPTAIARFSGELAAARRRADLVAQAGAVLARTPDDPQAALTMGRHLCLDRGMWDEGLPLLAKGADLGLKANAVKDLAAPKTWAEQAALGDAWKDAFLYGSAAGDRLLERAELWYRRARAGAPEEARAALEKRIAELPPGRRPIDLLPLVDPRQDTVYGRWTRRKNGLSSDASDFARCEIPFRPPLEYDLEAVFTRLEGQGDIVFFLTVDGKPFALVVSGAGAEARAWASVKERWDAEGNPTRTFVPGWVENGRVSTCRIEVRRASLRALLDGKLLVDRKITAEEMELPEWLRLRDPAVLGVGSYRSPTLVRRIRIVGISGRGRATR